MTGPGLKLPDPPGRIAPAVVEEASAVEPQRREQVKQRPCDLDRRLKATPARYGNGPALRAMSQTPAPSRKPADGPAVMTTRTSRATGLAPAGQFARPPIGPSRADRCGRRSRTIASRGRARPRARARSRSRRSPSPHERWAPKAALTPATTTDHHCCTSTGSRRREIE